MSLKDPPWKPTGATGHRIGWFGKIILTIEEYRPEPSGDATKTRWRDARAADFVSPTGEVLDAWRD